MNRKPSSMAVLVLLLAACAQPEPPSPTPPPADTAPAPAVTVQAPAPVAAPAPPPAPPTLAHAEAVLGATTALFGKAQLDGVAKSANERYLVVVDPLIDGVSRMQTRATAAIEARIAAQVKAQHPQFEIKPMSAVTLAASPLLIVGTFTPINAQGKTEGGREMYRFCLAMVDLRSGKVVSKTVARSRMEQVDHSPLPFFADAPAWAPKDAPAEAYVRTCQASKAGDALNPGFVSSLVAASFIDEGMRAYNGGRFKEAEAMFRRAQATPVGQQLRVLNGLYLSQWRQGRREPALQAFGELLDYGLKQGTLAMNLVFPPGATALPADSPRAPQQQWLKVLAKRLDASGQCAEAQGHTSRSGPEAVNERLSALRAEHVRGRLVAESATLGKRLIAVGMGSREALIGTAKDDASDQLDRRVEFRLFACDKGA